MPPRAYTRSHAQAEVKVREEQRMLVDERDVLHQEMSRIQNRLKLTLQVLRYGNKGTHFGKK